jgi:mono/diheme cytochrome c family protein
VLDPRRTGSLLETSIPIRNIHALEWDAYYIDPPRWPAAFGPVQPALAAAGEAIFRRNCAGCHEYGDDRRNGTGLLALRSMRPEQVGTDPTAALRIACPVPDTGALAVAPRSYSAAEAQLLKDCTGVEAGVPFQRASFALTIQTAVDGIKQKAYAAAAVEPAQQRVMEDLDRRKTVLWRDTLLDAPPPEGPYAARPLYGIWAAAPFLHNGSVPTLYDLLQPPARRPRSFALGPRDYDTVKLGFAAAPSCTQPDCLVDTARTGDGNGGHLWGTELSEPDRMALLEYLKTY